MVDSQDAGGLGAPEDNQVAQDQSIRNEDESGWGTGLPEALLVPVFQELENNPIGGPACARLACRRWAQAFRAAWLRLTPPGDMPPTSGGWQRSFPSLTELDLGQCGKMLPTFLDGAVWLTNLKTLCLPQVPATPAELHPLSPSLSRLQPKPRRWARSLALSSHPTPSRTGLSPSAPLPEPIELPTPTPIEHPP